MTGRETLQLYSSSIIDLMRSHRSVRDFTSQPVPDEMIEVIVEAAQWASSSCFRQSYSVIAVKDRDIKRELRKLCGGQRWVEESPVFLAFCADLSRLDDICRMQGKQINLEYTETLLMSVMDAALFMQNAALAAQSLGLGVVMIGGLRDHPDEAIRLLNLPVGVFGIAGMCLGYPELIPAQSPRLPVDEILHWEQYQLQGRMERLAVYDEVIRQSRVYRRKDGTLDSWSDVMARTTSKPPAQGGRRRIMEILNMQGFEMK